MLTRFRHVVIVILAVWPAFQADADEGWFGPDAIVEILGHGKVRLEGGAALKLASVAPFPGVWGQAGGVDQGRRWRQALLGKSVYWRSTEFGHDRHGIEIAQIKDADGLDPALELVRSGDAIVDAETLGPDRALELRATERRAREQRRGFWANGGPGHGMIARAGHVAATPFRFAIVEGRVQDIGRGGGYHYLNFGENWRDDFTVRVPEHVMKAERIKKSDLERLLGKSLSIRGWIFQANGPMIQLTTMQQIELLP